MADARRTGNYLFELGFNIDRVGDEMHGTGVAIPELLVSGTTNLRTSILAAWADSLAGLLALDVTAPRVPVTLQLDVQLFVSPREGAEIRAVARSVKSGRSVVVLRVDFLADGEEVGLATTTFMPSPDPKVLIQRGDITLPKSGGPILQLPFAERVSLEHPELGVAVVPMELDGRNASKTLNGGLLALAIEEAALSLSPGELLSSLAMHYLQPVRVGPAVARADVRAGLGRVEVCDAGRDDRVAVVATTRTFGACGERPRAG